MDFVTKNHMIYHVPQALPPISNPPNSTTNFPTIAIIVVGMMATSLLLMAYYTFVIKCCVNWNNVDLLRSFSVSRLHENQSSSISIASEARGLDQEAINSIPIIHYKSEKENGECAFCLSEFQQDEKLRVIPNCNHLFHIDCVDIWLQNNANCPLCRSKVSLTREIQVEHVLTPRPSPYFQSQNVESIIGGYEDFVVIDLDNNEHVNEGQNLHGRRQERGKELEVPRDSIISPLHKKAIKFQKFTSMGDECIIGMKDKFDDFLVQPIRRSISMDLSIEVCGDSSSKVKRSFFSFGNGSISRSYVLPIHLEP